MLGKLFLLACFSATAAVPIGRKGDDNGDVLGSLSIVQEEIKILKEQNKQIAALTKKIDALENELHTVKQNKNADVDTLFLATISVGSLVITDEEVIEWDSAPINPGGHFSTDSGAYTAPVDGYYQFSVTKTSNDNRAAFWLLVDEDRFLYNYLYESDATPSTSATINIQLTAGQVVRVQNYYSSAVYGTDSAGSIWSWFTGYMLYAS